MATGSFFWNLGKKYFTAGLIGLTISDRYAGVMAVRGSSMSPTLNPHEQSPSGFVLGSIFYFRFFFFFQFIDYTGS